MFISRLHVLIKSRAQWSDKALSVGRGLTGGARMLFTLFEPQLFLKGEAALTRNQH